MLNDARLSPLSNGPFQGHQFLLRSTMLTKPGLLRHRNMTSVSLLIITPAFVFALQPIAGRRYPKPGAAVGHIIIIIIGSPLVNERPDYSRLPLFLYATHPFIVTRVVIARP